MNEITLSEDQEKAYKTIAEWFANGGCVHPLQKNPGLLTFAGIAGTGKTTITSLLIKEFGSSIRFACCALSGRAASVLGNKLKEHGVVFSDESHYCGTIHRLIYKPVENDKGEIIYWAKKEKLEYDLIVLDEASMISEDIFMDLSSYGIDILAVGDHGQLPPIEGKFCLMKEPHIKLERIHRQAENNPIIALSMQIRQDGKIPANYKSNEKVQIIKKYEYLDYLHSEYCHMQDPKKTLDKVVLCYKNATRASLNNIIRKSIFGKVIKEPLINDIVICLKNSIKKKKQPLYNGFRGYITSAFEEFGDHFYEGKVSFPFEKLDVFLFDVCKYQFGYQKTFSSFDELHNFGLRPKHWEEVGLLFDFGYCITTHKSQGSSSDHVILFNERPAPVDDDTYKRWLYTSATRSSDKLTIIL
jgi:exodeoxyribonuclease-5